MTPERRRLALRATGMALRVRQQYSIAADHPCCVYDLAEKMGVEIRFAGLPSAEGVYSPVKPVAVVSSLRPPGRQAFTCAHELGHHAYGHGEQFDELMEDRRERRRHDPKEFEADCFASALLMPKTAVLKGLALRGWNLKNASAAQVYALSSWLGVGYVTLIGNMQWGMNLIDRSRAGALSKIKAPQIRKTILGRECKDYLIVVDEAWIGRPVDAQAGDVITLPKGVTIEGDVLESLESDEERIIARAVRPGIGRLLVRNSAWAQFIRVSRKQFTGLARFRHLEDVQDE
jgi:IrrE N-terminal-like domain